MKIRFFIVSCLSLLHFVSWSQANVWATFTQPPSSNTMQPVYGTQGVASASNSPGTRAGAVTWTDNSGDLWLFGGVINANFPMANDLWRYNRSTNLWTWMKGPSTGDAGVYGTQGVASASVYPSGRTRAGGWTDSNGDLWLFGGSSANFLDDLWRYSVITNEWTWMKGSMSGNMPAIFGTMGVANSNGTPGSRSDFVTGTDAAGNLWLFGGIGGTTRGDVWKYDLPTNDWIWMGGTQTGVSNGTFTQQGVASASASPGCRFGASGCVDANGNLWVFGGYGYPQVYYGVLNDLWKYNLSSGLWTWVSGDWQSGNPGVYGTKGVPSANNSPPKRVFSTMKSDLSGNLWLYAGNDGTVFGTTASNYTGNYSDLWRFNPSSGEWTWMSGSNLFDQLSVSGAVGVGGVSYMPGARHLHGMWRDTDGFLWVYGGPGGSASTQATNIHLDLWRYGTCNPATMTVNAEPMLSVTGSGVICLGQTATLSVTGATSYSLLGAGNSTVLSVPVSAVTPTQTTVYTVAATNSNNCSAQAAIAVSVSLCQSIEPVNMVNVIVFPNPFTDKFVVEAPECSKWELKIYDIAGHLVFSDMLTSASIDPGDIEPGLYFLQIADGKRHHFLKMIKE